MAPRSRVSNADRLMRKLRRMPDEVTEAVKVEINAFATAVLRDAQALAAPSSRRVAANLKKAILRKGLRAEVGIRGKRGKRVAWFAHFIEFGTRPHSLRRSTRGSRRIGKLVARLEAQIRGGWHPGTRARPFLFPAFRMARLVHGKRIRTSVDRALARVARGG